MKQEDYVTLEVAKLLKEKGFNQPSKYYYRKNDGKFMEAFTLICNVMKLDAVECVATTLAEAAKWLREQHDIEVSTHPFDYAWDYTIFNLSKIDDDYNHEIILSNGLYDTYEQALNEGIKESLKYI